jgi:phytoene synthase
MTCSLQRSYRHAEHTTAIWARSFRFASRFLPADKKRAIFALYDYCRHADNLVDERGDRPVSQVRQDLAELACEVAAIHAGAAPSTKRWLALADTLQRYPVPLAPLLELLDGVSMDLEPVEIQNFAMLYRYCRYVAGGVGLMLGPVLGAAPPTFHEAGVRLGIAMQLTNVLRDVGEDLANGRVYLPADELAGFGLSRAALETRRVTPAFRGFMQWQVQRARRYFEDGGRVVPLFPNDGSRLTVRLLQRTYAGILDAIERIDYDVFHTRAFVSTPRKFMMLGRAVWSERPWMISQPSERSV